MASIKVNARGKRFGGGGGVEKVKTKGVRRYDILRAASWRINNSYVSIVTALFGTVRIRLTERPL